MSRPPRLLISAGEASGDRLGGGLARALLAARPDVELIGMGGAEMAAAGVRIVQDCAAVSVVGIFEVLSHLPAIRRAMRRLEQCILVERPDLVVPIDFPDFHLRLAEKTRRADVEVVYFVSPQVWAWRRARVRTIRRLVRRMLVLFPFEVEFYESAGVPVTFVGHPVVEPKPQPRPREVICAECGLDPSREVLALLPGSRRGEVERLLPVMIEAARILASCREGLQFVLPVAPGLPVEWIEQLVARTGGLEGLRVRSGGYPELLSICRAGAVASGTASLEAAVSGLPIVVVYRMNPLSYAVGRALVRLDHYALPNLVAGRHVVTELIQGDCTGPAIAVELERLLADPATRDRWEGDLRTIRERLGRPGVYERAAAAVLEELAKSRAARSGDGSSSWFS